MCKTLHCTQNFTHEARPSVTENQLSRSVFRQFAIRTPVGRYFNVSSAPPYMITALKNDNEDYFPSHGQSQSPCPLILHCTICISQRAIKPNEKSVDLLSSRQ